MINEYLKQHKVLKEIHTRLRTYRLRELAPKVVCRDGFEMSVQASSTHYCLPRMDDAPCYTHVEIGCPSGCEESLFPYTETPEDPTGSIYGYVPVEIVDEVIRKHGGIYDPGTEEM